MYQPLIPQQAEATQRGGPGQYSYQSPGSLRSRRWPGPVKFKAPCGRLLSFFVTSVRARKKGVKIYTSCIKDVFFSCREFNESILSVCQSDHLYFKLDLESVHKSNIQHIALLYFETFATPCPCHNLLGRYWWSGLVTLCSTRRLQSPITIRWTE